MGDSLDTIPDNPSTRDLLRALLQAQLETSRRQSTLEDVILKMSYTQVSESAKPDSADHAPTGIDLNWFRTSDGPIFKGPF